ncbi:serine/threonine-protein kinase [Streptomyces sp. NPDC019396]|uniref:serine/threonine-protein kinase n=1 Tax=Streptomyces sp. NPDC019396 TaxID=3154687 RepID=UPI0033F69401
MESLRSHDPPQIGGYRLLARLGAGGMGEVFLARTASGRALAVKTVHPDVSREPGFAERFAREIRTSDRVRSPWTVTVVDFSPPGQAPQWLATEYVPAPSLGDWVQRYGPLPEPAVRCLARELSAALVAVREAGVVHRDIKPGNILLGPERPLLIDFGIARAVRDARQTQTGAVIGTPGFLAPEQATGAVAGPPADVFSLAAVLVYAATGRGPFSAAGEEPQLPTLLYRIVHDEPLLDGIPASLAPLVKECLAKAPDERPTADDVRARLAALGTESWTGAAPSALVAETGRREAGLRHLLSAPEPTATATVPPPAAGVTAPPYPASPPPPHGARRTRRLRTIAAATGAAVLAAAAIVILPRLPWSDGGGSTATPEGPSPSAASSSAATSTLPAAWVGTWSGVGPGTPDADGISRPRTREFSVTVTLHEGAVGDLIGRQVSDVEDIGTGRNLGCTEALELRQVRGDTMIFAALTSRPTDPSGSFTCRQGNMYIVTKSGADRLTLALEGAQSAGAPSALTRSR